jgi:hypothetical protein
MAMSLEARTVVGESGDNADRGARHLGSCRWLQEEVARQLKLSQRRQDGN